MDTLLPETTMVVVIDPASNSSNDYKEIKVVGEPNTNLSQIENVDDSLTEQKTIEVVPVNIIPCENENKETYFERLIIRVIVETCNLGDELNNNVTIGGPAIKPSMYSFDYFYDTFQQQIFEAFEIKNMTGCEISHIKEVIQTAISDTKEYGPSTVFFNMKHDPEVEHIAFMYILSTINGSIQHHRQMQDIVAKSFVRDNIAFFNNIDDLKMIDTIINEISKDDSRISNADWYVFSSVQTGHVVYNKKECVFAYNIQDPHTFIGNGIRENRFYRGATLASIGLLGIVSYVLYKRYN